jgi:hypothetical protein
VVFLVFDLFVFFCFLWVYWCVYLNKVVVFWESLYRCIGLGVYWCVKYGC